MNFEGVILGKVEYNLDCSEFIDMIIFIGCFAFIVLIYIVGNVCFFS